MPTHPDILDEQDPIRGAVVRSFGLHISIAALVVAWGVYNASSNRTERWGNPKSLGGGAVAITPVASIPLPSRQGRVNPVANDTESQIPAPPKPQPEKKAPVPDPAAVPIKSRNPQKKPAPQQSQQKYTPLKDPRPNQSYSSTGQAATTPMFSQAAGGGGVGSGVGSPFGNRFGWYEQLLRERVAKNWRSQDLDSKIRNRVSVTFDIARDGSIRNVRVTQPSGVFAMDQSAQRAILMSNPLPPLPREFERDVATVEFWFSLQQ